MRTRLLVAALLGAAVAVHLALTVPLQRSAGAAGEEYRRMRDQRRHLQSRLGRLERGQTLRRRAQEALAAEGPASEDMVRRVRRSVVDSLEGASVSKVRIAVRPGTRGAAASVSFSAEGDFEDVVRLSSRLVGAGTGLVLQTVAFSPRSPSVAVSVEAVGPGGPS